MRIMPGLKKAAGMSGEGVESEATETAVGKPTESVKMSFTNRDVILYALGGGYGLDHVIVM